MGVKNWCLRIVLNVIAKSKKPGSSKQLFTVLQKFEEVAAKVNPAFVPDAITHSIILEGLRKDPTMCRKPETVDAGEGILNETIQQFRLGNAKFKPKLVMFDQLIMLIAQSDATNKAHRAWEVLQLLKQTREELSIKGLYPKLHTYNWILVAASTETIQEDYHKKSTSILELSTKIFTEMKENKSLRFQADSLTYNSLLKIAREFVYNEVHQRHVIEDLFVRCCLDGMMDRGILKTLHHCSPGIFHERVVGEDGKTYRPFVDNYDFPEDWMRNVERKYRPHAAP